jgi:hypothetical protein
MPTAKLIGPRRLNIRGKLYERDVDTEVEIDEAKLLDADGRFKVKGLYGRDQYLSEELAKRPTGDDLLEAIADAINDLDNIDENYDRSGKPAVGPLSSKLGYPITLGELKLAIERLPSKRTVRPGAGVLEAADGTTTAIAPIKKTVVIKAKAEPAKEREVDVV